MEKTIITLLGMGHYSCISEKTPNIIYLYIDQQCETIFKEELLVIAEPLIFKNLVDIKLNQRSRTLI